MSHMIKISQESHRCHLLEIVFLLFQPKIVVNVKCNDADCSKRVIILL